MEQNTGMSISDWSGLVAMIVSFCALLSPMLTALCNNWHQQKMKRMDYEHQEHEERIKREREIYEGYIRAAGAAIQSPTVENLQEYGSHSALAAYYVPKEIQNKIAVKRRTPVVRTPITIVYGRYQPEISEAAFRAIRLQRTTATQTTKISFNESTGVVHLLF